MNMKKMLALLLAMMMVCMTFAACGGGEEAVVEDEPAVEETGGEAEDSAVAADNEGTSISDEDLVALTEAYNKVAPLYNEAFTSAEANGWMADEQTATEIQTLNALLGTIGQALTEDLSMIDGADIPAAIEQLELMAPELEKLVERVSVPFE